MDMREIMTNCFAKLDAKFIWKMWKKWLLHCPLMMHLENDKANNWSSFTSVHLFVNADFALLYQTLIFLPPIDGNASETK